MARKTITDEDSERQRAGAIGFRDFERHLTAEVRRPPKVVSPLLFSPSRKLGFAAHAFAWAMQIT
jgi:hypothetical protein